MSRTVQQKVSPFIGSNSVLMTRAPGNAEWREMDKILSEFNFTSSNDVKGIVDVLVANDLNLAVNSGFVTYFPGAKVSEMDKQPTHRFKFNSNYIVRYSEGGTMFTVYDSNFEEIRAQTTSPIDNIVVTNKNVFILSDGTLTRYGLDISDTNNLSQLSLVQGEISAVSYHGKLLISLPCFVDGGDYYFTATKDVRFNMDTGEFNMVSVASTSTTATSVSFILTDSGVIFHTQAFSEKTVVDVGDEHFITTDGTDYFLEAVVGEKQINDESSFLFANNNLFLQNGNPGTLQLVHYGLNLVETANSGVSFNNHNSVLNLSGGDLRLIDVRDPYSSLVLGSIPSTDSDIEHIQLLNSHFFVVTDDKVVKRDVLPILLDRR